MPNRDYDLTIIGGGPGGYVAAIRAAQLGMKVGLVEKEYLGGVCLNWGCIPTKSLLRNAEVVRLLGEGREFGFEVENVTLDYGAAVKRSQKISQRLVKGVELLMKKREIDVIWGAGRLTAPTTVNVELNEGGSREVTANHVILATGATPCVIPGMEPDGERVLTARHAVTRETLPASAIIIGGGPIGLEIGTVWSAYGAEVRVVEMMDQILPAEDPDAAKELSRALRRQKIKTLTSTRVKSIERGDEGVRVKVTDKKGKEKTLEAEVALVAVGFCPTKADLGLDTVGVERTERGWIKVDGIMQTNQPHLYAIGDANGKMLLAHVASAQGILAVETMAGIERQPFDANTVPRGTYTSPQVAAFGLSEAQAKEEGMDVEVGQFSFLPNGKALALGENWGFVKIVAEAESHAIIGATIVGPEATELLPELVTARTAELTPHEIATTIHAHPTLNEAVMEAAHDVFGETIHGG